MNEQEDEQEEVDEPYAPPQWCRRCGIALNPEEIEENIDRCHACDLFEMHKFSGGGW